MPQERHRGEEGRWNLLALTLVRIYRARMVRHSMWFVVEVAIRYGLADEHSSATPHPPATLTYE